jgi:hypothetical protein
MSPPIAVPIESTGIGVDEEPIPTTFPYNSGVSLKEPDKTLWSDSDYFQFCSSPSGVSTEWPSTSPKQFLAPLTGLPQSQSMDDLTSYIGNRERPAGVVFASAHSGTSSTSSHLAPAAFYNPHLLNSNVPGIDKDGRRFVCPVYGCARRFKRLEHLKRHGRTHTGERPFNCPIVRCGKKFSRSDNLVQHLRIHINNKDDAGEAEKFLQRVRKISRNQQPNSENYSLQRIPYDMMLVNQSEEGPLQSFKEIQPNIYPTPDGIPDIYLDTIRPSDTNPFLMQVTEQIPPQFSNPINDGSINPKA